VTVGYNLVKYNVVLTRLTPPSSDKVVQAVFADKITWSPIMENLLFANIPHDCKDDELRAWIEARGFKVRALKLIRDVVSGSSPSFARVQLSTSADDASIGALDRQPFGGRCLQVRRGRSPLDE